SACLQDMLVIPPLDYPVFGWRKSPPYTLVLDTDQLTVIAAPRNGPLTTVIPLKSLLTVELVIVLLHAHLRFTWVEQGRVEHLSLEFNSVGEQFICRQLNQLRTTLCLVDHRTHDDTPTSISRSIIDGLPLKFQNYLTLRRRPSEQVLAAVYEPSRSPTGRWFRLTISPNRVVAVTDAGLIVLEDEVTRKIANYTIITRYYPRDRISEVSFEAGSDLTSMKITLGYGSAFTETNIPLSPGAAAALESHLQALHIPTSNRTQAQSGVYEMNLR
ncbi:MAG TPA: hypothetical protein VMT34_03560, partial [Aggregatilineales bacterium]|nr:hypothetical protein [Aggregatilineales bacterium]